MASTSELDKISDQIAAKEKQVLSLQNEIEELKTKAHDQVKELMKRFGIDAGKVRKTGTVAANKSAEVKAEIASFLKTKKTIAKADLVAHLKHKLKMKSVLLHHYTDTIKVKDGNVTLIA